MKKNTNIIKSGKNDFFVSLGTKDFSKKRWEKIVNEKEFEKYEKVNHFSSWVSCYDDQGHDEQGSYDTTTLSINNCNAIDIVNEVQHLQLFLKECFFDEIEFCKIVVGNSYLGLCVIADKKYGNFVKLNSLTNEVTKFVSFLNKDF